jgi:hypothetical protein
MAAADVTMFPPKGQAYRVYAKIVNATTGNPITGGLTTLASTVSKDGAAFASTTSSATEVGTTGYVYVDLSSTEMDANTVIVHFTAANANAVYASVSITTADLTEPTGHARAASVLRLESFIVQTHMYLWNKIVRTIATGTISLYNYGATVVKATFARNLDSDSVGKGEGA